jgi:hypothetical protein
MVLPGARLHRQPRAEPLDANDAIRHGIYPMGCVYQVDCTDTRGSVYITVPYLTSRDGLPCHVSGAVFLPRKITVNFLGKSDVRKLKTRPVAFSQPRRAVHILELQALRCLREVYVAGESVRVWLAVPNPGFMILASLVARGGAQHP